MSFSRARSGRVLSAVAVLTAAFMTLAIAPAQASSMFFSKSSGRTASAEWLEVGTLPGGVPGNIHFGFMQIEDLGGGQANVWGGVNDLTCPEGVIPDGPPGHGPHFEEPVDNSCVDEGFRFIDGGNVTFTMDRRFSTATLTGNLSVFGHDGGGAASPPVNMTWTGIGEAYKSTETSRYSDGTSSYFSRYSFAGRDAQIAAGSRIGAMIFDNVAGEWSTAQLGSFRNVSRERIG